MIDLSKFDPRPFIRSFNGTYTYRIVILILHIVIGIFYFYLTGLAISAQKNNEKTFDVPVETGITLGVVGGGMIVYHILSFWTRTTLPI